MRILIPVVLLVTGCFGGGCAVVSTVGTVGSLGVSAASTAGGLAVSGASATLSGASSVARAGPRFGGSEDEAADEE